MPDIEISEECRALIGVEFDIAETARRLPNGNWQIPIDEKTWRWLQKVRLRGESISEWSSDEHDPPLLGNAANAALTSGRI